MTFAEDNPINQNSQLARCHDLGRDLLYAQTRKIDELIQDISPTGTEDKQANIFVPVLMMQAVGVSIHSVLTLTQARDMGIRDCFGIARSAVETAINAAFISVSGASMADKAVRHMRQKRWRDLRRQTRIGNQTITISQNIQPKIDDFPGLREAFEEYTSKKGEEIRSWTPENIKERIAVISRINDRAGLCLGASTFSIYRPASELLHGTFYGVNLFWQGSRSRPTRHRAEFDTLWLTDHFVTVLLAHLRCERRHPSNRHYSQA